MRIGHGYDAHALTGGRELVLGGCLIPFEKGLDGHSDADVLIHAVIDALFGAAASGDIGSHFPDSDDRYKGISSVKLLAYAGKEISTDYRISNIDATVIAQRPKLLSYIQAMRRNIANALCIDIGRVSVKATTEEHMGFTGRGEGISAHAVVLLEEKGKP